MKMNARKKRSSPCGVSVTIGAGMIVLAVGAGALAAQTSSTTQSGANQRPGRAQQEDGNGSASGASLSNVIATMSRSAGVQILADRAVANFPVTAPAAATTAANIDEQIKAIVSQLPVGSVSGKFYLPASSTIAYTADSVEQFALAEARLFGPVGGPQAAGTVEVLGQKLAADKAAAVIADLNLQPIYLIGNPSQSTQQTRQGEQYNSGSAATASTTGSGGLTSAAQNLLAMSAGERDQALLQMLAGDQQTLSQVLQNVPAGERQQILQSLRNSSGTSGSSGGGFGRHGGGFGAPPGGSN